MRVRSNYFSVLTAADACSSTSYGEVEDYVFNILASNL
jgi:hypothetical protein